jgi:hypothetical protein
MDYRSFYQLAREAYARDQGATSQPSVYQRSVAISRDRPPDWLHETSGEVLARSVGVLAEEVAGLMNTPTEIFLAPGLAHAADPARRLTAPRSLRVAQHLAELLLPGLERNVYGSYVQIDKVYIYRSVPNEAVIARSSWRWHYDNHPAEVLKLMVYLTPVDEGCAPFEYLVDSEGVPVVVPPSRTGPATWCDPPRWPYSRVPPEAINAFVAAGHLTKRVTGPRATFILFDNNIVHRANIAMSGHRDVVVFQLRPTLERLHPPLSPDWTGSHEHVDISPDPSRRSQEPKTTFYY